MFFLHNYEKLRKLREPILLKIDSNTDVSSEFGIPSRKLKKSSKNIQRVLENPKMIPSIFSYQWN